MAEIKHTVTINRSVGEVYRFVADFNNDPQWQKDVTGVHQSEGALRVGTMITESRSTRAWTWKLDLNADVIDLKPNKLIEFKGVLGIFPARIKYIFNFSRGTTEFTQEIKIHISFLYKIFSPFIRRAVGARTQRTMENLKALMEKERASGVTPIPERDDA